jgi:hypothetical protein
VHQHAPHAFPATRHSVVRAIGSPDPEVRAVAYDALVRTYWRPVYAYIRCRWRREVEDARDLTQEFFARDFEKAYLARFDPGKARFRTFLRTCLDAFLSNERQAASRLKRGGGVPLLRLDFDGAEADIAANARSDAADPERWFHEEWTRALVEAAVAALRARCAALGRATAFALFEEYDLAGGAPPTYAALGRAHGIKTTDVTNRLAWVRRAFREELLRVLRDLSATDEEFRAQARDLLGRSVP